MINLRIYRFCFILLIIALLLFPLTKIDHSDSSWIEKRMLASFPEGINENFGGQFDLWLNDRFRGRQAMLKLSQELDRGMVGYYISKKAAIGQEGWLFYTAENSIANYQNKKLFSDAELDKILHNIKKKKEILSERGIKFYIMIAPDKNRIYGEKYMPYINKLNVYGRAEQLVNYLRQNGVDIIYPIERLLANKDKGNVYLKFDTHWNYYGAFIGYDELMERIIRDNANIRKLDISQFDVIEEEEQYGDLLFMLNMSVSELKGIPLKTLALKKKDRDEFYYIKDESQNYRSTNLQRVYVLRDSFGTAMIPYISETFSSVKYKLSNDFNSSFDDIIDYNPDIVIQEVVERYIWTLAQDITVE